MRAVRGTCVVEYLSLVVEYLDAGTPEPVRTLSSVLEPCETGAARSACAEEAGAEAAMTRSTCYICMYVCVYIYIYAYIM